jgi:hypothetical protein
VKNRPDHLGGMFAEVFNQGSIGVTKLHTHAVRDETIGNFASGLERYVPLVRDSAGENQDSRQATHG